MRKIAIYMIALGALAAYSCSSEKKGDSDFQWQVDKFADIKILRYQIPDFDSLSLKQKELVYYLSQAALSGRDILWDQNYKYNLAVRRTLEAIYTGYSGDRNSPDFEKFVTYLKRVRSVPGVARADNLIVQFMNINLPTGSEETVVLYAMENFARWIREYLDSRGPRPARAARRYSAS